MTKGRKSALLVLGILAAGVLTPAIADPRPLAPVDAVDAPSAPTPAPVAAAIIAALNAAGAWPSQVPVRATSPVPPAGSPPVAGPDPGPARGPSRPVAAEASGSARPQLASDIAPTDDPVALAHALAGDPALITGASFVTRPTGTPTGVSTTPLAGFPRAGDSYAVLTTGDALLADQPNDSGSSGVNLGGSNIRGNTDFDVTILKVDIRVPPGANCITGLDFRFLSDEYPEYVGSRFNDAFIAEVDRSTWTTNGSDILAPDNFVFDPVGSVISVNAAGVTSMTAEEAAGTTYDGATPLLTARVPVAPGDHSLYLSIFDQGDHILDSAVFIDNLRTGTVANVATQCVPGATLAGPMVAPAHGNEGEWVPVVADVGTATPAPESITWSAVPGPNVDPGATCRFSDAPPQSGLSPLDTVTDLLRDAFSAGQGDAHSLHPFVRCTDDGQFDVTLTIAHGTGPPTTATGQLTLDNVLPTVAITAPESGTQVALGRAQDVSVGFADPGTNDTHVCRLDWGDGTSSPGTVQEGAGAGACTATHTYGALGQYVITAYLTDDDTPPPPGGPIATASVAMSVAPSGSTPGSAGPTPNPGPSASPAPIGSPPPTIGSQLTDLTTLFGPGPDPAGPRRRAR